MYIFNLFLIFYTFHACSPLSQNTSYQKEKVLPTNQKTISIACVLNSQKSLAHEHNIRQMIRYGLDYGLDQNVQVSIADYDLNEGVEVIMERVIKNNTDIILGPMLSDDTRSVAAFAIKYSIPVLSFSNDVSIITPNTYVFGHSPLQQTERIIQYLSKKDIRNFILLLPENRKAIHLKKIVTDMLVQKGLVLVKVEHYIQTPEDVARAVSDIAETVDRLNDNPENTSKPAIYLFDEPENIPLIFDVLRQNFLDTKAVVCGENKIDIEYLKPINITFTGSLNNLDTEKFNKNFQVNNLNFWDKMAFDLGLITGYALSSTSFSRKDFLDKLNNSQGFNAMGGIVAFDNHVACRIYDIIERKTFTYHIVDLERPKL